MAKSIWTACFAAVVVIGVVGTEQKKKEVRATLAEANRLWDVGNRPEAGARYNAVIATGLDFVDKSEHPMIFQRAIEVEVAQGNTSAARTLIDRAVKAKIVLSFDDPKTKELVALGSSSQSAAKVEENESRTVTPSSAPRNKNEKISLVLTADYYPFRAETRANYLKTTAANSNATSEEWWFDGAVGTRFQYHLGTMKDGEFVRLHGGTSRDVRMKQYRRVRNGYVEVAEETAFGTINPDAREHNWKPLLKVGATAGDSWEWVRKNGVKVRFELKKFDVAILRCDGKKRQSVVIVQTERHPLASDVPNYSGAIAETSYTFVKGIGLLEEAYMDQFSNGQKVVAGKVSLEVPLPHWMVNWTDMQKSFYNAQPGNVVEDSEKLSVGPVVSTMPDGGKRNAATVISTSVEPLTYGEIKFGLSNDSAITKDFLPHTAGKTRIYEQKVFVQDQRTFLTTTKLFQEVSKDQSGWLVESRITRTGQEVDGVKKWLSDNPNRPTTTRCVWLDGFGRVNDMPELKLNAGKGTGWNHRTDGKHFVVWKVADFGLLRGRDVVVVEKTIHISGAEVGTLQQFNIRIIYMRGVGKVFQSVFSMTQSGARIKPDPASFEESLVNLSDFGIPLSPKKKAESSKTVTLPPEAKLEPRVQSRPTLQQKIKNLANADIVGVWLHRVADAEPYEIRLQANSKINKVIGSGRFDTWSFDGKKLILRWPDANAPEGAWIDECTISPDGKTYEGTNQDRLRISGRKVANTISLKEVTLLKLNTDPGKFDGQTVSVRGNLSGTLAEGGTHYRLTMKGTRIRADGSVLRRKGINLLIPKAEVERLTNGLKPGRFYPVTLTVTVSQRNKGFWVALVTEIVRDGR